MTDPLQLYRRNHRYQQLMLAGGVMTALAFGFAPSNERALFVIGAPVAPKAFAAIASPPPQGLFDSVASFETPRRSGLNRRLLPGRRNPAAVSPFGPAELAGGAAPADNLGGVPGIAPDATTPPTQVASLGRPAGPPGAPLAGSDPGSFGPAAATPVPTAPPTSTPEAPVGPVPEPSTWAMLLLGFFGLGALLRGKSGNISSGRADRQQI